MVTWRSPWVSCKLPLPMYMHGPSLPFSHVAIIFPSSPLGFHLFHPFYSSFGFLLLPVFTLAASTFLRSRSRSLAPHIWSGNQISVTVLLCAWQWCAVWMCVRSHLFVWQVHFTLVCPTFHCTQCAVCLLRGLTAPNIFIFAKFLFPMHIHSIFVFMLVAFCCCFVAFYYFLFGSFFLSRHFLLFTISACAVYGCLLLSRSLCMHSLSLSLCS